VPSGGLLISAGRPWSCALEVTWQAHDGCFEKSRGFLSPAARRICRVQQTTGNGSLLAAEIEVERLPLADGVEEGA
jgi:hypothetical protein